MELEDLVNAIVTGNLITAREWIAEARRSRVNWERIARPTTLSNRDMAVAAGLAELLAERDGQLAPPWAVSVGGTNEPFLLDPGLDEMPRSFERAKASAPEALRKRNLLASPDFLKIA